MPFLKRVLVPAVLLATAAFAPRAAAQMQPGGAPADVSSHRRAYLAEVMGNVETVVQAWRSAREAHDVKALASLYANEAVFFPYRGKAVTGRREVEAAMGSSMGQEEGFRATMSDFTAGGGLAYYAGEFQYMVRPATGEPFTVAGSYILVLERGNGGWKIRSHVERADLDVLQAQGQLAFPAAPADSSGVGPDTTNSAEQM